jgi:hypothetical protein
MMRKSFKNTDRTSSPDRVVMYCESPAYQAVRLPYKGCSISAIAVLPSEAAVQKHGLAAAVADLEVEALLDRSKYRKVGCDRGGYYLVGIRVQLFEGCGVCGVRVAGCEISKFPMLQG